MNANAPIEPTSAWPMWIQVVIRSVIGAMSGVEARNNMLNLLRVLTRRLGNP